MSAAFALAGIGFGIAAFAMYRYWMGDIRVAGFTSILASVWIVGSCIMASIGVVGIDENTTDTASALRDADGACYAAKRVGRNAVRVAQGLAAL